MRTFRATHFSPIVGAAFLLQSFSAAAEIRPIALSGPTGTSYGLGPNIGSGIDFTSFRAPVLNSQGKVAFLASVSTGGGMWSNAGGPLSVIVGTGAGIALGAQDPF